MATRSQPGEDNRLHLVKRYAGSRLYDISTRAYVTIEQLRVLLCSGEEIAIYDASDGSDITQSILLAR